MICGSHYSDSAHGHSKNVVETIKAIKKEFTGKDVIAGNVATPEGAEALIAAGADSVKIGMGPGLSLIHI